MTQKEKRILAFVSKAEELRAYVSNKKFGGKEVALFYTIQGFTYSNELNLTAYYRDDLDSPNLVELHIMNYNALPEDEWQRQLAEMGGIYTILENLK